MPLEEFDHEHNVEIASRLSFLREILLNQGLTSLGDDSRADLNAARDLNDTRHNCRCGSVISIGSFESLLDTLFTVFSEDKLKTYREDNVLFTLADRYSDEIKLLKQLYPSTDDFISKDVIGIGQFGEVKVVQEKHTGEIYAMKTLRKAQLFQLGPSVACFKEERDVMVRAYKSPWVANLVYSFQDSRNLYLIMKFYAGGDLLNVLEQFDPMKESMARFYLSEISTAIHFVHEMGYIHRDVKPENVLVDVSGHIKLADFGSAAALTEDGRIIGQMPFPVGTPEYVAPEVLSVLEHSGSKSCLYGRECDWWSLGVLAYEMLVGRTPFESGSRIETHANIQNYKKSLVFPTTPELCKEAVDLISSLCTGITDRIGFYEITRHEFFNGIDWDELLATEPPYIPKVKGPDDVSNFDSCDRSIISTRDSEFELSTSRKKLVNPENELCFVGYSYLPFVSSHVDEVRREDVTSLPVSKPSQGWSDIDELRNLLKYRERELDVSVEEKGIIEKESDIMRGQVQDLRCKLESERNDRVNMEERTLQLLEDVREGSRKVTEMREADTVQRVGREQEIVLRQLTQEKELAMQRARRLEEELMLKNSIWDEQANDVNEMKKKLMQARVEANNSSDKFNKLAEEAHAHLMQKKKELEMKELSLEAAEEKMKLAQQNVMETDKQLCHEIEMKEASQSRLVHLTAKLKEMEEQMELDKLNQKEIDDQCISDKEREKIQDLEQELFDTTKTKEDLESSEFMKDTQIQQMEQELIEVLAEKDHIQEELELISSDFDMKEKEYVTQREILSQLEQDLNTAKIQLQRYEEDTASRLEYKHKQTLMTSTHEDGAQSDTELIVGITDHNKEIKLQYSKQISNLRAQLDKEMKEHTQAREKYSEHNRVTKKRLQELERSLEHQKSKFACNETNHKSTMDTLEKRNIDLQNQCNKSMGKVADMRRVQTSLEREIQQMKKQEVYKEELRSKLSSANFQEKIKQSDQEINRLNTALVDVNKLNKDYEQSVRSLQTELRNLRTNSLRTESQLQQANQQLKADKVNIGNLCDKINSLEQNPSANEQTEVPNKMKLQSQIDDLKSKLTQESQRLRISEQELQDTNRTLQRAQNLYQVEIDSWKKLHEEENRKYVGTTDKNRKLEGSLQMREEEIQHLQRKEISIANQMLELKQQLREANETVRQESSKDHVNQLSQELAYEKASKEEVKIRLNELRERDEAQSLEIITLKKKMDEVLKSNSQLSSLRTEYRALKDSELESSKHLNELKSEIEENWKVRQNFDKMKLELVAIRSSLESKSDEVLMLQQTDLAKAYEIEKFQEKLQHKLEEINISRDEVKKVNLELKEAEQQMSELRTTTSKHELQSVQWTGEQAKLNDVISTQKSEANKIQTELMHTRDEVKKLQMVVRQLEKGSLSEPERVLDLEDEITSNKLRLQELEDVRDKYNRSKLETENHTRIVNALREDNSIKEMEISKLTDDKLGVEERNRTLALQLDLQFQELQKAKDEATCARFQVQQLKATKHKLIVDLDTANKRIVVKDSDEADHNLEEKIFKEREFRMETQLQQQAKLINYLADSKSDGAKWSNKLKKKEIELNKDRLKALKPTQILYPPKTNGSDSGITSIESDLDRATPVDPVFDTPHSAHVMSQPNPFSFEGTDELEGTPLDNPRHHGGMFDRVKKTLSGRRFETPTVMTGSRQLNSKSLKDVAIPRIDSDKLSPTSLKSTNTYSLSSCSETDGAPKRSKEVDESDHMASPPKKICSEFQEPAARLLPKHFFSSKICKSGVICDACTLPIKFGERKEKCAFCRAVVHPKCSSHYDRVSQCQSKLPPLIKSVSVDTSSIGQQPSCDWFKVLFWPCPRQCWEKYFIILADDALLLYQQQPSIPNRSEATRILKLGPYDEAIVSVNNEFVRKRLSAFSNAQYSCTLALLLKKTGQVICDNTEAVYLHAPSTEKKSMWIDLLIGTINDLEKNRNKRPPFVMEVIYRGPFLVQQYFFSAMHIKEHNFILLAEHTAIFAMSMPSFVNPWSEPIKLEISQSIAPIYTIKLFAEMGMIVMIAGKERQIFTTLLEPMIEYIGGLFRDKKKPNPKFIPIPNSTGCHMIEVGKITEIPFMCSFHQDLKGTGNRIMSHFNQPSNHTKCPLQLYDEKPLAQCSSILVTPGKFLIGSHVIVCYNPMKKFFRESQISMHNNAINETKTLRNPIEMLALPGGAEYLLVYSDMGVVISRQGGGIYVNEEAVIWESTPTHAWTDNGILFILSSRNVAVYRLVKDQLPTNPTFYKLCSSGGQFLCYIPFNKSMLYTSSEGDSTFIFSCEFLFHNLIKRTGSVKSAKSMSSNMKRQKTTSLIDMTESVL